MHVHGPCGCRSLCRSSDDRQDNLRTAPVRSCAANQQPAHVTRTRGRAYHAAVQPVLHCGSCDVPAGRAPARPAWRAAPQAPRARRPRPRRRPARRAPRPRRARARPRAWPPRPPARARPARCPPARARRRWPPRRPARRPAAVTRVSGTAAHRSLQPIAKHSYGQGAVRAGVLEARTARTPLPRASGYRAAPKSGPGRFGRHPACRRSGAAGARLRAHELVHRQRAAPLPRARLQLNRRAERARARRPRARRVQRRAQHAQACLGGRGGLGRRRAGRAARQRRQHGAEAVRIGRRAGLRSAPASIWWTAACQLPCAYRLKQAC